jgi:hypothetical protein
MFEARRTSRMLSFFLYLPLREVDYRAREIVVDPFQLNKSWSRFGARRERIGTVRRK